MTSLLFLRFIYVIPCVRPHCMHVHFIYALSMDTWVASTFWPLWIMQQWMWVLFSWLFWPICFLTRLFRKVIQMVHYFRNLRATLESCFRQTWCFSWKKKKTKNKKLCHMHIRLPGNMYSGFKCCVLSSLIRLRNYVQWGEHVSDYRRITSQATWPWDSWQWLIGRQWRWEVIG